MEVKWLQREQKHLDMAKIIDFHIRTLVIFLFCYSFRAYKCINYNFQFGLIVIWTIFNYILFLILLLCIKIEKTNYDNQSLANIRSDIKSNVLNWIINWARLERYRLWENCFFFFRNFTLFFWHGMRRWIDRIILGIFYMHTTLSYWFLKNYLLLIGPVRTF